MTQVKRGRSGRVFFAAAVLVVFTTIVGTVLGANDLRNLNLVLAHFGYPSVKLEQFLPQDWPFFQAAPGLSMPAVRIVKGVRLPPPTIRVPLYARANLDGIPTTFVRAIRADPRSICDALRENGFPDIVWTTGAIDKHGSECSSFLSVGNGTPAGSPAARPLTEAPDVAPAEDVNPDDDPLVEAPPDEPPPPQHSSVFVVLKGDVQGRVLTFRVKFNIEVEADRAAVVEAGSRAVETFLRQVHWQDDGDMLRKIEALQEFDRDDFGSRIVFKREMGDLPRYNFLARQSDKRRRGISDAFFDPFAWFPVSDAGLSLWMPKSALSSFKLPPFPNK